MSDEEIIKSKYIRRIERSKNMICKMKKEHGKTHQIKNLLIMVVGI